MAPKRNLESSPGLGLGTGLPKISDPPLKVTNFEWVIWKLPLSTKKLKAKEPDGWEPPREDMNEL